MASGGVTSAQDEFGETNLSVKTSKASNEPGSAILTVKDEKEPKAGPRRFSLLVGAGGSAFLGSVDYFLTEWLQTGFVANSYLGYRFSRLRHSAGIFGRYGNISGRSARQLTNAFYLPVTASIDNEETVNNYFEVEAGVLLWEFVRVSAGKSWTLAALADGSDHSISLGTATVGVLLRTGPLRWFMDGSAYFDKELNHFYFRPSAGLYIQIYMIRFY